MLIVKDFLNDSNTKRLFEESIEQCSFYAIDFEMSGISIDLKTQKSQYDFPQLRYEKMKKIVTSFEVVQMGISFYIESFKKNTNKKFYLERTFCIYLCKSSPFAFVGKALGNSLFRSTVQWNPKALKFLNKNCFDFRTLLMNSLHYNQIEKRQDIENLLREYSELNQCSDNIVYLSTSLQKKINELLSKIVDFLLKDPADHTDTKTSIKAQSETEVKFLLALDLSRFLSIRNFIVLPDKQDKLSITVQKSRMRLDLTSYNEKFNGNLPNYGDIFNFKYSNKELNIDNVGQYVNQELGFSVYIEKLIKTKKPMIGHNLDYDIMFLYDKFIGDLPDTITEFKSKMSKLIPCFYDTKVLALKSGKMQDMESTTLEKILSKCEKIKLNKYIDIFSDLDSNFCNYDYDDNIKFHDAGYDSRITGRSFIHLCNGFINKFAIEENDNIINRFVDLSSQFLIYFKNKTVFNPILTEPFTFWDFLDFNENAQEEFIVDYYSKHVIYVIYNEDLLAPYEMAKVFENESYNVKAFKCGERSAFVAFSNCSDITGLWEQFAQKGDLVNKVVPYREFYSDYNKYLEKDY